MAKVAAGGRRLAAQIVVSVIATGAAALLVPQILTAIGYGGRVATVGRATMPAVQAPADFEAAFVWPVQTPPGAPEAATPSVTAMPAIMPAIMPVPMPAPHRMAKARADAPAPRLAALAPRPAAARPPLQLVAMTSAATASATPASATLAAPVVPAAAAAATTLAAASPAPAEGRSLLGIAIPKLPYEDRIVAPLVRARDAVRSLF